VNGEVVNVLDNLKVMHCIVYVLIRWYSGIFRVAAASVVYFIEFEAFPELKQEEKYSKPKDAD